MVPEFAGVSTRVAPSEGMNPPGPFTGTTLTPLLKYRTPETTPMAPAFCLLIRPVVLANFLTCEAMTKGTLIENMGFSPEVWYLYGVADVIAGYPTFTDSPKGLAISPVCS